jgi:hypothetical protein
MQLSHALALLVSLNYIFNHTTLKPSTVVYRVTRDIVIRSNEQLEQLIDSRKTTFLMYTLPYVCTNPRLCYDQTIVTSVCLTDDLPAISCTRYISHHMQSITSVTNST